MAEYIEVTELSDQIARIKRSVELNTEFMNSENSTYYLSALQNFEKAIATIPKADVVEVRHGEWINERERSVLISRKTIEWDSKRCSECGYKQPHKTKYCPNCGAKMDKEREQE